MLIQVNLVEPTRRKHLLGLIMIEYQELKSKNLQNYVNELIEAVDFFGTPASSGSSENKDLALLLTGVFDILSTLLPFYSSEPTRFLVCSCNKLLLNSTSLNIVMMLADFERRKEVLMGSLDNWLKMEYVTDCKTFGIKTPQVETQIWTLFLDIDCPASLRESFERCITAVFTTRIAEMELERRLSYLESRKSRLPPTLMDVFTASLLQSIVDGEFKEHDLEGGVDLFRSESPRVASVLSAFLQHQYPDPDTITLDCIFKWKFWLQYLQLFAIRAEVT